VKSYVRFLIIIAALFGEAPGMENSHEVYFLLGNWNGHYLYRSSEAMYRSPSVISPALRIKTGIRVYGSPYLLSKGVFEIPMNGEYDFPNSTNWYRVKIGGGINGWGNLHGQRWFYVQPQLMAGVDAVWKTLRLDSPVQAQFYNNGLKVDWVPQLSIGVLKGFQLAFQPEFSVLTSYNFQTPETRFGFFLGFGYLWKRKDTPSASQ
jgi:hypothetical protein